MIGIKRALAGLFVAVLAAGTWVAVDVGAANAYGGDGAMNVWQIAVSFNCNNKAFCGSENLGGFWGWAEIDENPTTAAHTGDAEFTGCSHGEFKGAAHTSVEVTNWHTGNGSAGPNTLFTDEVDTTTFRGQTTVETLTNSDTGVSLTPGHYSTSEIFGFDTPPGVAAQIQVAYKPAH